MLTSESATLPEWEEGTLMAEDVFESELDLAFAHWLQREEISQNAIRRFLSNIRLQSLVEQLS